MKKAIKEYLYITLGMCMIIISAEYFIIPNNIAGGGVTGLSVILHYYFPAISVEIFYFLLNIILFIIGFIFIGKSFGVKTLYAAFGLSGGMWLVKNMLNPTAITKDLILAVIFGSLLTGSGLAIVFNQNASTGGTDIIAKILNKYISFDMGKAMFSVDIIVTILCGITFGWEVGMYALLFVMLIGLIIDRVIEGFNVCKQVMIMSAKNEDIRRFIMEDLDRGCTIFNGKGGYSGEETYVLYSVLSRKEFIRLKHYLKEVDPKAFITVNEVHEVLGEGFKNIF
ncbi:YitT family protein [Desnuesiella massiliensis]|uniref:YitT family protein n=1 Tax=Desnuesiella massiliensis TaxID=1650662 RepID=UPI0006E1D3A4|nr:YitT family protein [Desnuesiella massiliensis]